MVTFFVAYLEVKKTLPKTNLHNDAHIGHKLTGLDLAELKLDIFELELKLSHLLKQDKSTFRYKSIHFLN